MGGNMKRKKRLGVRVVSGICPAVKKTTMPTMIPRMIRAQCYKTFYGRKLLIFVIS
jgi:hypothetical protein